MRVGLTPPYSVKILYSDGSATTLRLQLDMDASSLALYERGSAKPEENPLRFERDPDGLLTIEGDFQGRHISVELKREDEESLLMHRGFHWVTQLPLNR